MSERPCPEEPRLLEAWRAGTDQAWLREHVTDCESCREALDAFEFMRLLAVEAPDPGHEVPEAGRIRRGRSWSGGGKPSAGSRASWTARIPCRPACSPLACC